MAEASLLILLFKGILELLISQAKDPIKDQIQPVWGFKKDLKKLCKRLQTIHGLLEDAENQKVTSKAMLAWLKHLKAATCNAEDVLDELAYEDLRRKFEVGNHMAKKNVKDKEDAKKAKLASWMKKDAHSLQNLVKIQLIKCKLCEHVPMLGHLPNLAYLEMQDLRSMKSIGHEFYGPATTIVFPALIKIELVSMRRLEEWSDVLSLPAAATRPMDFFPRLQTLKICDCPKLITLPETAFKGATSLQRLRIGGATS